MMRVFHSAVRAHEKITVEFKAVSRSPFSPSQGEKVAVRPDEGVCADSDSIQASVALGSAPPAERRANSKHARFATRTARIVFCMIVCCLISDAVSAADPGAHERAFVRALELFDSASTPDDYRASARELESIVADRIVSGAVYYNLGNAYYRAGDFGRAILNYRKAKPFRPRDSYLEANLQQALASAPGRLSAQPAPWWTHVLFWNAWLSFPAKVQFAGIAMMFSAAIVVIAAVLRRPRIHLAAAALCGVSLAVGLDAILSDSETSSRAVITGETVARKGTGKDYEPAFDQPLRDGAEFTVLGETSGWTFGHFEGIGDGWVRNDFVAR